MATPLTEFPTPLLVPPKPALRCPVHHGSVEHCPTGPDIADVLPELAALGIAIRITPPVPWLDDCDTCGVSNESVATVVHRAIPDGIAYREPACLDCIRAAVLWHLRFGAESWIELPATIGRAA